LIWGDRVNFSIVVAVAKNNVIGLKGKMPWDIPEELKRFKEITMGGTVVMGRKTFESIGKPLPGRKNVVISRRKNFDKQGCVTVKSWEEMLEVVRDKEEVFIAGGREIYAQALPLTRRIYLTVIEKNYPGDVYFPQVDWGKFEKIYEKRIEAPVPYTFYTYVREQEEKSSPQDAES